MTLTLSQFIAAPPEKVFDALVDPAVIRRCIPGVESMEEVAPDTYAATLKIGVAGLKGSYTGKTIISNKQRPEALTLGVEGKGGPGFVRGTSNVALASENGGTRITCHADVQVGGLIAAVGSRLIEAAAKKMAADFFTALDEQIRQR